MLPHDVRPHDGARFPLRPSRVRTTELRRTRTAGLAGRGFGFRRWDLFMGWTCSAFAAGVMALGLAGGEIENNPLRVLRMLTIYAAGGDWADDGLNNFNRSMNRGTRLSEWFVNEFGRTQCRALTGCDFSSGSGVSRYVDSGCAGKCSAIAGMVAEKVREMLSLSFA